MTKIDCIIMLLTANYMYMCIAGVLVQWALFSAQV